MKTEDPCSPSRSSRSILENFNSSHLHIQDLKLDYRSKVDEKDKQKEEKKKQNKIVRTNDSLSERLEDPPPGSPLQLPYSQPTWDSNTTAATLATVQVT